MMRLIKYFFVLAAIISIFATGYIFTKEYFSLSENSGENKVRNKKVNTPPEISAWIAWWKEEEAYDLIKRNPSKLKSISPVWFFINKDLDLINVGEVDREKVVSDMETLGILLVPCLGSGLNTEELSSFLNNQKKTDSLIDNLIFQLVAINAYGVDIDLEGIRKEDRDTFSQFLKKLSVGLKKENIKLYVAVHAQTEIVEWEGVLGQDLKKIGEIADFVRIMTYDKHSDSSGPGAISPIDWMIDVVRYNEQLIDEGKIVIGIPTYSYIWSDQKAKSMQFDELYEFLDDKEFILKRDSQSKELVFKSNDFEAWLSDSEAMIGKVESLRKIGYNKFVIWSLGGMDERLFDKDWQ